MRTPKAFAIKHLTKEMREGFFAMREEYTKNISEKFAVKGKEGMAEPGTKSAELKLPFTAQDGKEADAKGALDAFGKKTLDIKRPKINFALLFECNEWTPHELEVLEFFVDEPAEA